MTEKQPCKTTHRSWNISFIFVIQITGFFSGRIEECGADRLTGKYSTLYRIKLILVNFYIIWVFPPAWKKTGDSSICSGLHVFSVRKCMSTLLKSHLLILDSNVVTTICPLTVKLFVYTCQVIDWGLVFLGVGKA